MNLDDLIKLRTEIYSIFENVKKEYNCINLESEKKIIDEELKNITKELKKIDNIIDIYKKNDKNYIVMKLERFYMMLLLDIDEIHFNKLSEDKTFEIFDNFFPDEWAYKFDVEEKEKLLLNAISKNEMIKL